ncbi:MAG: hypothetical protein OEW24_05025 [Chloroflexota bacterium]|nr:hypothetical protein [Chloroflexota bacterium]
MSATAKRLTAITVLLLAALMVAFLAARGMGFQVGIWPFASATPQIATVSPEPSGEPTPSQDPLAIFAEIETDVRALRGLPAPQIDPPQILTRAELADALAKVFDRDFPPEERDAENATLRALGLLTAQQDIAELTQRLYADQVLGYYDFDGQRMVVVTDAGLTAEARITYAHEYTHALQDAAFDTAAAHDQLNGEDDAEMARVALEEGDASTAMVLWAIGHLTAEELLEIQQTPIPDTSGIPPWMVRQLEFPYAAGAAFVGQLYASGGWDAVNAAYADPPSSTEQVLHPDAYIDGEEPIAVEVPDVFASLGAGWSIARETTLGEAMIEIWLEGIGLSQADAELASEGWGGDRVVVAIGPDGELALALRIIWDAPIEVTEFADRYADVQGSLSLNSDLRLVGDRETILLQATSAEALTALQAALGG